MKQLIRKLPSRLLLEAMGKGLHIQELTMNFNHFRVYILKMLKFMVVSESILFYEVFMIILN
ncbi:MAG TPA: hypothetical protein DCG75_17795 [Bacteroidales bacterium]|nr:hypothetical protein [Bacteroidales bacterium]